MSFSRAAFDATSAEFDAASALFSVSRADFDAASDLLSFSRAAFDATSEALSFSRAAFDAASDPFSFSRAAFDAASASFSFLRASKSVTPFTLYVNVISSPFSAVNFSKSPTLVVAIFFESAYSPYTAFLLNTSLSPTLTETIFKSKSSVTFSTVVVVSPKLAPARAPAVAAFAKVVVTSTFPSALTVASFLFKVSPLSVNSTPSLSAASAFNVPTFAPVNTNAVESAKERAFFVPFVNLINISSFSLSYIGLHNF